jgi:hypothetical protein
MIIANFDVDLTIHAEIKESDFVTVTTRILVDDFINQASEVGDICIHDFVQRKPPTTTTIGRNNPDF